MKSGKVNQGIPPNKVIVGFQGDENNAPSNLQIKPESKTKEKSFLNVGAITYITHPDLLAAITDGDRNVKILEDFICQEAQKIEQLKQEREQIYQDLLKPDDSLADEIIYELMPRFSSCDPELPDLDLAEILRKRFVISDKPYESYAIIKMLFSMQGMKRFLSDVIVPYLRGDEGLENSGSNRDFCIRLLNAQNKTDKATILRNIDYSSISKFEEFSKSLLNFSEPDEALQALLDSSQALLEVQQSNEITYPNDIGGEVIDIPPNSNEQFGPNHIPLMIVLSVLERLKESLKLTSELSPQIKELYKTAPNHHIIHQASEFLVNYVDDSAAIFKKSFLHKENESDSNKLKRFYAIGYFVWANKKHSTVQDSISTLVNFIKEEEDSYLIAKACFMLAEYCGTEGNDVLAKVIIDQVKNNKESLPLAALTMLLIGFKSEPYLTVFKKVISAEYTPWSNLGQAYKNLSDVKLYTVLKSEKEWTNEPPRERPELPFDLFKEVGLMTLLNLPESRLSDFPTHGDIRKNVQMKNLSDLLQILSREDFAKVRNMITEERFVNNK